MYSQKQQAKDNKQLLKCVPLSWADVTVLSLQRLVLRDNKSFYFGVGIEGASRVKREGVKVKKKKRRIKTQLITSSSTK